MTLAVDPRYSTDPAARFGRYDPATLDETWGLISDMRPLLKQYGPAETRVDLLNEGAPPPSGADDEVRYIQTIYTRYVEAFGADDVTVSAGFWVGLGRLVAVLRSAGKPLPRWFVGAGDHGFGSVGRPTTSRPFSVLTPG